MWMSISEAARALGISPDTVKRRMAAGQLLSKQEQRPQGYRWLVEVPDDAVGVDAGIQEESESGTVDESVVLVLRAEVARLEETVQLLAVELDARRRDVAELHGLLREAVTPHISASRRPPPDGTSAAPVGEHGLPARKRRKWWSPWQGDRTLHS